MSPRANRRALYVAGYSPDNNSAEYSSAVSVSDVGQLNGFQSGNIMAVWSREGIKFIYDGFPRAWN